MPGAKRHRGGKYVFKRTDSTAVGGSRNRSGTFGRNRRVSVPRNKLAFPQQLKTKLRYCVRKELDLTGNNIVVASLRANDLYDPEVIIGGHQPRGFDELMAVYDTFTVTGSTCSGSFVYEGYMGPSEVENGSLVQTVGASMAMQPNTRTPALPPVAVGIHKGIEALSAGPPEEQMEKDRTKWRFLTPNIGAAQVATSIRCTDYFGKVKLVGAEGYSGTDASGPTETILFEVWAGRLDNNVMTQAVVHIPVYIVVEYDCVFTNPKTLDAS